MKYTKQINGENVQVEITPKWESLFAFAETIVKDTITKGQGQSYVLEMLEYGKRLDIARQSLELDLQMAATEIE